MHVDQDVEFAVRWAGESGVCLIVHCSLVTLFSSSRLRRLGKKVPVLVQRPRVSLLTESLHAPLRECSTLHASRRAEVAAPEGVRVNGIKQVVRAPEHDALLLVPGPVRRIALRSHTSTDRLHRGSPPIVYGTCSGSPVRQVKLGGRRHGSRPYNARRTYSIVIRDLRACWFAGLSVSVWARGDTVSKSALGRAFFAVSVRGCMPELTG